MVINTKEIIDGLNFIGLRKGDCVLIHSSLSSFGHVEGGEKSVIEAIKTVVGDLGTLVVPTLTGRREDSKECPPTFDVTSAPTWTGIIAETVRKMEGSKRSFHPTHSVSAIGDKRDWITNGHEKSNSPCDEKSPFYKLAELKGKILLIGVDQESNTTIHTCEEIAKVPYHLQREVTEAYVVGYKGEKINVINFLHDWNKPFTDFNKLDELYYEKKIMKKCKIGNAEIRLIDAENMLNYTIGILLKYPNFLISHLLRNNQSV